MAPLCYTAWSRVFSELKCLTHKLLVASLNKLSNKPNCSFPRLLSIVEDIRVSKFFNYPFHIVTHTFYIFQLVNIWTIQFI
jgi:hypothetical protein